MHRLARVAALLFALWLSLLMPVTRMHADSGFADIFTLESDAVTAGGTIRITWSQSPFDPPDQLDGIVLHGGAAEPGIWLWSGPYMGSAELEFPLTWELAVPEGLPAGDYDLVFTYGSEPQSYRVAITVTGRGAGARSGGLTPTEEPPEPARRGKPPCAAAVREYGLDANGESGLTMDYDDLKNQFENAIALYNADEGHAPAHIGSSGLGMVPVLSWLAHQGGTMDVVSKRFVFANDSDRATWDNERRRVIPNHDDRWGTERRLLSEMHYYVEASGGKRLTPGDIFYLALNQRDGNATEAILLAHNTLRSLARWNDGTLTDVHPDLDLIDRLCEPVLTGEPLGRGQNAGALYHIFTTAAIEMHARGNWSINTVATYTIDRFADWMRDGLQELARTIKNDPNLELPQTRSAVSVFANQVEQFYRQHRDGSPDDPDKYCYNVFGAQLGAMLYRTLTETGAPELSYDPALAGLWQGAPRIVHHAMSPLDITWSGSGYRMTLHQESEEIDGHYPLLLSPIREEATGTWGVTWIDLLGEPYEVTLTATQTGDAHLLSIETGAGPDGNGVTVFPLTIEKGDVLRVQVEPGSLPRQVLGGDGLAIEPIALQAAGATGVEALFVGRHALCAAALVLCGLAALVGLLVRRRRSA